MDTIKPHRKPSQIEKNIILSEIELYPFFHNETVQYCHISKVPFSVFKEGGSFVVFADNRLMARRPTKEKAFKEAEEIRKGYALNCLWEYCTGRNKPKVDEILSNILRR